MGIPFCVFDCLFVCFSIAAFNICSLYLIFVNLMYMCLGEFHEKRWAGRSTSWNQDCWENINNLRYADDIALKTESEEELKSLLVKVTVESAKVGLKLNIQKTKIMASGPITSWEIDGETVETLSDFFGGAPKSLQKVIAAMKLKYAYSLEGKL